MPVVDIQRRFMKLGNIRLGGEKGEKQPGKKLQHFRLTSQAPSLLESAAREYGGEVKPWPGAPDDGSWQLYTETSEMEIILPSIFSSVDGSPTPPYSQWYELWSGGGCQRRCDGVIEGISGGACLCNPDSRECDLMTRFEVMLPKVAGLGIWLVQSHGYYAGAETTGTLSALHKLSEGEEFISAVLRLEQRTVKRPGEPTKKFNVPVIDLPETRVAELLAASPGQPRALPRSAAVAREKPPLPAGDRPPPAGEEAAFENDRPKTQDWGESPEIEGDLVLDAPLVVDETEDEEETNDQLTARLSQLLMKLGQGEAAGMIPQMRRNQGEATHREWLVRQIGRAEAKVEERQKTEAQGRET